MILQAILVVGLVGTISAEMEAPFGNIQTCGVHYVKPGDSFKIPCHTDHGIQTAMYTPRISIPSDQELIDQNIEESNERQSAESSKTEYQYTDAQKGVDDGWYTCVVFHGPDYQPHYSKDRCLVIIEDVCEGKCQENEACHASYPEGTHECDCDFGCADEPFDPVCSDRCEQFVKPCYLKVQTCTDGLDRNTLVPGFCQPDFRSDTSIRRFNNEVIREAGEVIMMTSGLVADPAPHITIVWESHTSLGVGTWTGDGNSWKLTVGPDTVGTYIVTLTPCRDPSRAVVNKVNVGMPEVGPTVPPQVTGIYYTCSIYPGGGVDQFDGGAAAYDLACTHVLAADVAPAGDIAAPWYVYGTFDNHDGGVALSAMTFYLGRDIFELQRGWIVNIDGEKMELTEGEVQAIPGGSGCTVVFQHRHLKVDCAHFTAYYDGIMSGHLTLKPAVVGPPFPGYTKRPTNFGLCNDGNSGFRPNWQVGAGGGSCEVEPGKPTCEDEPEAACDLASAAVGNVEWTTCGGGASLGCGEIYCGEGTATPAQTCALEQAKRVSCALKQNQKGIVESDGMDEACPKDECVWKGDVVSRGCYQKNLPFECVFGS